MSFKDLVERDCGSNNALVQLTSHFTQEKLSKVGKAAGHDSFTSDFLAEHREFVAPSTFHMDGLLQEMQEIERSNMMPKHGPDVVELAAQLWTEEFSKGSHNNAAHNTLTSPPLSNEQSSSLWSDEYLSDPSLTNNSVPPDLTTSLWAQEYLDLQSNSTIQANDSSDLEGLFTDAKSSSSHVKDDLSDVANDLLGAVDMSDPKLANSEFMKFIKQLSSGSVNIGSDSKQSDWTEEFGHVPGELGHVTGETRGKADEWSSEFMNEERLGARGRQFYELLPGGVRSDEWVSDYSQSVVNEAEQFTDWHNDVPHEAVADKWVDEFQRESSDKLDFWSNLQKQWEQLAEQDVDGVHSWLTDYDKLDMASYYKDYKFDEENHLRDTREPFEEGLKKLETGDISSAVLLFEAAVQNEPEHIKAWQYLGTTQASNEQDRLAIAALRRCLEFDENNLTALLSLAVSYTNESMQRQACDTLLKWIQLNPSYSYLLTSSSDSYTSSSTAGGGKAFSVSSFVSSDQLNKVKELFLLAVQSSNGAVDPDVQIGLVVLFNVAADYDKAVDCFNAALQVLPNDSLLWNKLGASLANGGRSEEAVEAYRHALDLSPGYIRTRYNLGVACINLGAYREAMQHFLTALTLQHTSQQRSTEANQSASILSDQSASRLADQSASSNGSAESIQQNAVMTNQSSMSYNIWSSVRTTLMLLNRTDLQEACDNSDVDLLNREFNVNV